MKIKFSQLFIIVSKSVHLMLIVIIFLNMVQICYQIINQIIGLINDPINNQKNYWIIERIKMKIWKHIENQIYYHIYYRINQIYDTILMWGTSRFDHFLPPTQKNFHSIHEFSATCRIIYAIRGISEG